MHVAKISLIHITDYGSKIISSPEYELSFFHCLDRLDPASKSC